MAIVKPFKAVRPAKDKAKDVISLPYDVMNREEASDMAKGNRHSFLHICRSEIDLPQLDNPYDPVVYEKAKSNIAEFIQKGIFKRDDKPCYYLYREIMDGRIQTGIVAATSIDDYQNDIIKKHEYTRVQKELDRINHFDICNANTEPVFLTYREDSAIRNIMNSWIDSHDAEYNIVTDDGITHILWVIDDQSTVEELSVLFAKIDYLYIADGHHRSASAAKVGMKRREVNPKFNGSEEFNFFMAVIFPDNDLKIFDYNRAVKDLNGLSKEEFMEKVATSFEIEQKDTEIYHPEHKHTFGMFLDGIWYKLTPKAHIIDDSDIIRSLDVSILQENLLQPILGIDDPRTSDRIDFIGGIRGLEELERRVNKDMTVAFALYPVLISDLLTVADAGMVMPPKSTWFEPKLGSGLFMHELD